MNIGTAPSSLASPSSRPACVTNANMILNLRHWTTVFNWQKERLSSSSNIEFKYLVAMVAAWCNVVHRRIYYTAKVHVQLFRLCIATIIRAYTAFRWGNKHMRDVNLSSTCI